MLHILTNPGISPLAEINQEAMLLVIPLLVVWAVGVILACWGVDKLKTKKILCNLKILAGLAAIVGLSLMVAVGCFLGIGIFQRNDQLAKYDSSVVSWLDTGYGIKTNTNIVQRLARGETFAVTYHGQEIVISAIENINGKLSIVDQNHVVLKPNS